MADFKLPSWSARNPLGIIALFISLIYGMSAVLLGASVKNLTPANQTILVCFIVVFPFVVLAVFGWLVSHHHTKLYGPSDYRTDKGFLDAGQTVPTVEVGQKVAEELAIDETSEAGEVTNGAVVANENAAAPKITRTSKLRDAYLAEGLVFQALQTELGGSVRREVKLAGQHVDGLIYSSDGTTTIVEVKVISGVSSEWARRIREARDNLGRARSALKDEQVRLLIALVVRGNAGRVSELRQKIRDHDGCEIRVYGLTELINQYGLGEEPGN